MKIIDVNVLKFHAVSEVVRDSEFHVHPGPRHDTVEKVLVIKCDDGTEGIAFGPMDERVILSTVKEILIGEDSSYEQQDKNNYGNILQKHMSTLLVEGAFDEPS